MRKIFGLLGILVAGQAGAQDFEAGHTGWHVERLSRDFVVLRTNIAEVEQGNRQQRQGLLILTCERDIRRVRFQIGEVPRSPSTHASAHGRAIVRGVMPSQKTPPAPIHPKVGFFDDGSFELQEEAVFGNGTMRGLLDILLELPTHLDVVLYKGPATRTFVSGDALRVRLHGLDENLGDFYAFKGLCFRAKEN